MARRKRILKVNPLFLLLIAFFVSFLILWSAKDARPIVETYDDLLSSSTIKGSLFGKIIEKIKSSDNSEEKINDGYKELIEYISEKEGMFSVYIMDLDKNRDFGYNENKLIFGASLYKVPIAVAVLDEIENGNIAFKDEVTYKSSDYYGGSGVIQVDNNGLTYDIEYLLSVLLKYSDNIAQNMLSRSIDESDISNSFLLNSTNKSSTFYKENKTSAKEVSEYFKNIKRGGYLDEKSKDLLFEYMGETAFDNRISENLKPELTFSHKIGNWGESGSWHDCGIISGQKNLSVCLMSENTKFDIFLDVCEKLAEFLNFYSNY